MISKKWLSIWFVIVLIMILIISAINFYIDSYAIFKKNFNTLYQEPNQSYIKMNFLLNKQHLFDSFIFGSSRVGHINPNGIKNGNYYNMTYSEGLPFEHLENIKLLIKKKIAIKNIIIAIDDFSYEVDPKKHLGEPMRLLHYETDYNNMTRMEFYIYYLLKIPSVIDIARLVKEVLFKKIYPTYRYDIYNTGLPITPKVKEEYIEKFREIHIKDKKFMKPTHYEGQRITETINTIKELVQLSKNYKFNLILFINPIHKTTYLDTDFKNFQKFKKKLSNIYSYYDFSGLNTVTKDNYYYYETSHYRNNVGELIKAKIFNNESITIPDDFGVFVTNESIEQHLVNLKEEVQNCNYMSTNKLQ